MKSIEEKLLSIQEARNSKCPWISNMAGICKDRIIKEGKTLQILDRVIEKYYEELQGMKKAVKNTPGAC